MGRSKFTLLVVDIVFVVMIVLNSILALRFAAELEPSKLALEGKNTREGNRRIFSRLGNASESLQLSQAQELLGRVKQRLEQPSAFPFQPTWSNEIFDPDGKRDADMLDRLKTHVRLRNFYSSYARLTPEFKQLYDLLSEWGIRIEVDQIQDLYMCLEGIQSSMVPLEENIELVDPRIRNELEDIHQRRKQSMSQVAKSRIQIKDDAFWDDFFRIQPKIGFGAPDTRIEPGEALLVP